MFASVNSEIGKLEAVIVHSPGGEVENMTPLNAERALYSDILNLSVAGQEYYEFREVLKKTTKVYEVNELLETVLENDTAKKTLLNNICANEHVDFIRDQIDQLQPDELASKLIEGVPLVEDTLTKYLSADRYSLQPLHNFFFTRDASITIREKVLIARMSSQVREREAIIMEAIFNHHPEIKSPTVNPLHSDYYNEQITIEGGDVLVAREDILMIGIGARTTSHGVDYILERVKEKGKRRHILVQELPLKPESFIHLDMVFTFLDYDKCMIYEPVVKNRHDFQTIHITVDNGKVESIREERDLIEALGKLGIALTEVNCGGRSDPWVQEREQWHSGANFFALGPGKVIGYGRNENTIDELSKHGFDVLKAKDIIAGKINLDEHKKYVITIPGSELSRGGGGCRCMTMPVKREQVNW